MASYLSPETSDTEDDEAIAPNFFNFQPPKYTQPLIPPNLRKVRHIIGVAARNLRITHKSRRPSSISTPFSKTNTSHTEDSAVDDGSLSLQENSTREASVDDLSFSSTIPFPEKQPNPPEKNNNTTLPKISETTNSSSAVDDTIQSAENVIKTAPRRFSHRRRSIRDLSSEFDSGLVIQRTLNDIFAKRLFSTFFTIHTKLQEEPIYVSETLENVTNPQFHEFDLTLSKSLLSYTSTFNPLDEDNLRETQCIVSLWGKTKLMNSYELIVSEYVSLSSLVFIGYSQFNPQINFPPNSLLICLTDGIYILPKLYETLGIKLKPPYVEGQNPRHLIELSDSSTEVPKYLSLTLHDSLWDNGKDDSTKEEDQPIKKTTEFQYTLSYDAIMKLNNLEACIIDASHIKTETASKISEILTPNYHILKNSGRKDSQESINQVFLLRLRKNELKNKLEITKKYYKQQVSKIQLLKKQIASIKAEMLAIQDLMAHGDARQRAVTRSSREIEKVIQNDKSLIQHYIAPQILWERSRIATDLSFIFPVVPIEEFFLKFTICGVPMVDSYPTTPSVKRVKDHQRTSSASSNTTLVKASLEHSDEDEFPYYEGNNVLISDFNNSQFCNWIKDRFNVDDATGAAYGFAAQVVSLLSYYLDVPLRYPVQPFGSQSFIIDPVSNIKGSRTFPLWTKNSLYFRFQYAQFLFNKDIEQLLNSQGVNRLVDIRPTLANLKNLLLVISSIPQNPPQPPTLVPS